jgi:hypothetical protein
MKARITFFFLLGIACALVHFDLIVLFLPFMGTQLSLPQSFSAVSLPWVLTLPSNLLMTSSWDKSDLIHFWLLLIANSLL